MFCRFLCPPNGWNRSLVASFLLLDQKITIVVGYIGLSLHSQTVLLEPDFGSDFVPLHLRCSAMQGQVGLQWDVVSGKSCGDRPNTKGKVLLRPLTKTGIVPRFHMFSLVLHRNFPDISGCSSEFHRWWSSTFPTLGTSIPPCRWSQNWPPELRWGLGNSSETSSFVEWTSWLHMNILHL